MNKKMILIAIFTIFVMIGVSLVSAVNTNTQEKQKELNKIDSPLFKIRTEHAITEKASFNNHIKNIITDFLENRIFMIKINWFLKLIRDEDSRLQNTEFCTLKQTCDHPKSTCSNQHTECGMPTGDCFQTCSDMTKCAECTQDCTSRATILCGSCTQGKICNTLNDQCKIS